MTQFRARRELWKQDLLLVIPTPAGEIVVDVRPAGSVLSVVVTHPDEYLDGSKICDVIHRDTYGSPAVLGEAVVALGEERSCANGVKKSSRPSA